MPATTNTPTTNTRQSAYCRLRDDNHPACIVCGLNNRYGLGLEFRTTDDGVVEASFACPKLFESYPAALPGGVI